MDQTT